MTRGVSLLCASLLLLSSGCDSNAPTDGDPAAGGGGAVQPAEGPIQLPTGEVAELTAVELRTGEGPAIETGDTAVVHYTGWLYDPAADDRRGRQFDSSRGGEPYSFSLGAGRVILGWEEGVAGMRPGGRRYLFIPPEYGYGERGFGAAIPPNSTLFFDVELIDIEGESPEQ